MFPKANRSFVVTAPAVVSCLLLAACGHSSASGGPATVATSVSSQPSAQSSTSQPATAQGGSPTSSTAASVAPAAASPTAGPSNTAAPSTPGTPTDASSAAAQQYRAVGAWSIFQSPSGKNLCSILSGGVVGCALDSAVQAQHDGHNNVFLSSQGVTYGTGDMGWPSKPSEGSDWTKTAGKTPPRRGNVYVLPYGSSITSGALTCTSTMNGFHCTEGSDGFTVNSAGVTRD